MIVNASNQVTSSSPIPCPAIGFTAICNGTAQEIAKTQQILERALSHFENLTYRSLDIGRTRLILWGRGNLDECCHLLADGSMLALIGSPSGRVTWETIEEKVLTATPSEPFVLPCEGRVILLRVDPQNNTWTLWNDWVGSIPVFHAQQVDWRIASTLEPAVVETLEVGEQDIFLPGLLALLMWGYYFSDWTLFKSVKVIPPDCEAHWEQNTFQSSLRYSVQPSEQRWNAGWDEILEEMYVLSRSAIASVLKEQEQWILPLSSGLDSRLIAGVAAELNIDVRAYTWGRPKTSDVIHSKEIARVLGIPWKYLNPGNTYLTAYRDHWMDLFGSAMHFHGMYQMPFLDDLKQERPGPILSGFLGESLAGGFTESFSKVRKSPTPFQQFPDSYLHWTIQELRELMNVPIQDALDELAAEHERLFNSICGADHQRLSFINIWGRQHHFIYFQSLLSDYWRGVATPYLNRDLARFFHSLPRPLLDNRVALQMMYARYYPKLASIPGTYAKNPILINGSYLLKKRISRYLPESISKSVLPGLYRSNPNSDGECVVHSGKGSFSPVFERLDLISSWMNGNIIEKNYQKIFTKNNGNAIRKLQSIQTLAYRLSAGAGK